MANELQIKTPEMQGLVFALLLDGQGGCTELSREEVEHWKQSDGFLWLHWDTSAVDTKDYLRLKSGIPPLVLETLVDDEEDRPRCMSFGDNLLLFLRAINLNAGEEPDDMISLRIWAEKNRLITMRSDPMGFMWDIKRHLEIKAGASDAGEMLDEVLSLTLDKIVEAVSDIEDNIDFVEDKIMDTDEMDEDFMPKLSEFRRNLTEMRRYLAPQREAMEMVSRQMLSWLDSKDRFFMHENANRMLRIIEDIDSLRERAKINIDELTNRGREQMQQNMNTLSVLAAIFIPLTFVTGLFGMNVGGIPGQSQGGFSNTCIVLIVIGLLLAIIFKKLKWY
ncbi:MAG: zinc transporter ZntB [Alphaproteobacteria bacterium]|nr:zinc transporter ZntB [Alphaproteobacteria bacterium]